MCWGQPSRLAARRRLRCVALGLAFGPFLPLSSVVTLTFGSSHIPHTHPQGRLPALRDVRSAQQISLGVLDAPAGGVVVVFMHVVGAMSLIDWRPDLVRSGAAWPLGRLHGWLVWLGWLLGCRTAGLFAWLRCLHGWWFGWLELCYRHGVDARLDPQSRPTHVVSRSYCAHTHPTPPPPPTPTPTANLHRLHPHRRTPRWLCSGTTSRWSSSSSRATW